MAEQEASAGGREDVSGATVPEEAGATRRLAILLAMAMFVLVVDTSVMNVSISAVVLLTAGLVVLIPIVPRAELGLVSRRAARDRGISAAVHAAEDRNCCQRMENARPARWAAGGLAPERGDQRQGRGPRSRWISDCSLLERQHRSPSHHWPPTPSRALLSLADEHLGAGDEQPGTRGHPGTLRSSRTLPGPAQGADCTITRAISFGAERPA